MRESTDQHRWKKNCTHTERDFKLCQQIYQVHQSQWWLLVHLELVKFITNRKEQCRDSGSLASRSCFGGTGGFNSFQWSCKDDGRVNGEMNDKNNNFYLGTFGRIDILILVMYIYVFQFRFAGIVIAIPKLKAKLGRLYYQFTPPPPPPPPGHYNQGLSSQTRGFQAV